MDTFEDLLIVVKQKYSDAEKLCSSDIGLIIPHFFHFCCQQHSLVFSSLFVIFYDSIVVKKFTCFCFYDSREEKSRISLYFVLLNVYNNFSCNRNISKFTILVQHP